VTVALPAPATSGRITITVDGLTGTSSKDFLIGCADGIISNVTVSNIAPDNSFTLTHTVKNIGTIPLQINKMIVQQIMGKTMGELNVVASVASNYLGDDIPPNGTRVFSFDVNDAIGFGNSIKTYPFIYVNIAPGGDAQVECGDNRANNSFARRIR
jgi:hypothetical protein